MQDNIGEICGVPVSQTLPPVASLLQLLSLNQAGFYLSEAENQHEGK
jgi:hypothetical protein